MDIGNRVKEYRNQYGLTQQELADRTELSKGFISQLERNLTSPSISTLVDILQCLGTTPADFFADDEPEQIVFKDEDYFEKTNDELNHVLNWVIPNAQKNSMEPLHLVLHPGGSSEIHMPHEGEEFGYVLKGSVKVNFGTKNYVAKQGDSFYFKSNRKHWLECWGSKDAKIIWVATPPSF